MFKLDFSIFQFYPNKINKILFQRFRKQKIVTTLSDFIYVDTGDVQNTQKHQEGSSDQSSNEQELEDQLMGPFPSMWRWRWYNDECGGVQ